MDNTIKVEMGFVQRRLPWMVGGAMMLVFLVTMNRWITPITAVALGKVAGWDWRPNVVAPLHVLLTWPVRWLPAGIQLFALNFFEVACAALSLALLARSVALLPHDRTKDQRQLERSDYSLLSIGAAWVPPLMAALVCGLQLNFWENAVASNGEMLDLLVFAYLVRCLLEFRLDHNERWLKKLAFVYGLSVVNNFAMIGFFPAFLLALVWIKWATFFNWRFVGRMLMWGCLGLLLYLVLPLLASLQTADYSFTELLRSYWNQQRLMLMSAPRYLFIFLALTSILPVLFIGIRWPASFGDTSPTGQALTNLTTHVIHLIFLAACLYVTFDLEFSPRRILYARYAALPFYYLGALSIGYFAGYLLLIFGAKPDPNAKSWQRPTLVRQAANIVMVAAVWVLLVAVPAGLAWKNVPIITARNSPALSRHVAILADSLPPQATVVMGDDVTRLYALQAELRRRKPDAGHIVLESVSLEFPAYHHFLAKRHGPRLPNLTTNAPPGTLVDAYRVTGFLLGLSQTSGLYYIHPSFGYFFELFYLKPSQGLYRMVPFTNSIISPPVLSEAELKSQDGYWKNLETTEIYMKPVEVPAPAAKKKPGVILENDGIAGEIRMVYSRALNHFGFEAQRAGNLKLAADYFDRALQLNSRNLYAFINKDYNRRVQAGHPESLPPGSNVLERIEPYPMTLDQRLNLYGPPDEPSISEYLAQHFHGTSLFRQSAQWLERSLAFEPTNINRRLFLISEELHLGLADQVLELVSTLRNRPPSSLTVEDQIDLTRAEAWAQYSRGNLPEAEDLLRAAQKKYPQENSPFSTLADIYLATRNFTNAVPFTKVVGVYEEQIKLQPNNAAALVSLSMLFISSGQQEKALPFLQRAINLKPDDAGALFARGLCNLHLAQIVAGRIDAPRVDSALADFLQVTSLAPKNYTAWWGVGECYRLKRLRTQAIKAYQTFLEGAPAGHPDRRLAEQRIKLLKSGGL
ncbi:MAG: hypothetical protein QOF48_2850 [Verrucomicrobiota bacterium]|jgi:tetratricopeptide (TPR) repeat protein